MSETIRIDLPDEYWKPLEVFGVGRDAENGKALVVYLKREFSDAEMRAIHEGLNNFLRQREASH